MIFHLTPHAISRITERNIPDPNIVKIRVTGRKTRKTLRERCKSFNHREFIYFSSGFKDIYVCKQIDVGEYLVITAFNISDYGEKSILT